MTDQEPKRRVVFIVEDDHAMMEALQETFSSLTDERNKCLVFPITRAAKAIELLKRPPIVVPLLVVTDIHFEHERFAEKEEGGLAVIRAAAENIPGVPVIVFTGMAKKQIPWLIGQLGGVVFYKSADELRLLELARTILNATA